MDALPVTIQTTPQQIVIHTAGGVTGQALTLLENVMQQALAQPELPVVLDLRLVTQIDDKGLSLIRTAGQQFVRSQRGLTIRVTADTQPARVLELSQMDNLLLGLDGPDAWFVYRIDERTLVSLLEIDRGTERGTERWEQKLAAYGALFASGQLAGVTGYVNARVLVIAPTERRRDWLGTFVAGQAEPQLARRFWLSKPDALSHPVVGAPCWQQPGSASPQPLVNGR